jgi:hypothetical protein
MSGVRATKGEQSGFAVMRWIATISYPATVGWAPYRTNRLNGAQHLVLPALGN